MATVVGTISLSHSPLWNLAPDPGENEQGGSFVTSVERCQKALEALRPDAVVIFAPDHARGVFYDMLPPFAIGVESVRGAGDYFTPKGSLPVARDLAQAIFAGVTRRGFDPALSLDLLVDHGITQVYARLVPGLDIPIVPILVNSGCPPLPTFSRSFAFGKAVGEAISEFKGADRVVTIGSGGLSHWPNSTNAYDESISSEWRDFLINGRPLVEQMETRRVNIALEIAGSGHAGRVAEEWDRQFLHDLSQDPNVLRDLDAMKLVELAGPGAGELRAWAAATAAWGKRVPYTGYEAVPKWITGMGIVSSVALVNAAAAE